MDYRTNVTKICDTCFCVYFVFLYICAVYAYMYIYIYIYISLYMIGFVFNVFKVFENVLIWCLLIVNLRVHSSFNLLIVICHMYWLSWCPFFRAVGTFARALDCSSSVRQPSLHMSAAAASRDITLVSSVQTSVWTCTPVRLYVWQKTSLTCEAALRCVSAATLCFEII